jgi:MraZ protein
MLMGEYRLSLDGAGRLTLPCAIRYALRQRYAPDDAALILTSFFDHCLVCYPQDEWRKMPERLRREGACKALIRDFQTNKAVCRLNGEGRLYIPVLFRQHAAIERDVLLIGIICYLELWAPQLWEAYVAEETRRL